MAKGAVASGPGVYSATYSGIPVFEFQFGQDLKEHVMRRRDDHFINATHILKAAGFDKPARTRILEREVQKDRHEKVQGGYGKYQGTWIPLEAGEALAQRNNIYERLRPIFVFEPGSESPPPAPRHASKPKAPRKPAVPKWSKADAAKPAFTNASPVPDPMPAPVAPVAQEYDNGDTAMNEEDTPDNLTVASASFMAEDDRLDLTHPSTGHRKRKREESMQDMADQQHYLYGDELLDYFLLSRNEKPTVRPEPPPNFQPDWVIDTESHTALHWASAMGDVDIVRQLKRFGASLATKNIRGETPLMRAVHFTNCFDKQSFPLVVDELFETVDTRDSFGCTVLHHAASMKYSRVTSHSHARYYLDNVLNKLLETHDSVFVQQLIDAQNNDGNTALHLAAMRNARKCIRALLGRKASTDIPNVEGVRAEDLIRELNASKRERAPQRSSSPFAPPDSRRHASFRDALGGGLGGSKSGARGLGAATTYDSAAAKMVQSRIAPLVLEKIQDLAQSYDEEWLEKDEAEKEARRILANTQGELAATHRQIAELESLLEPDDAAAKVMTEASMAKHQVLSLITHQNRVQVQQAVDQELGRLNGDLSSGADDGRADAYDEQLDLARQLKQLLEEQRQAEVDYVEALSTVGTGEKIEKYRRLLKRCLDPREGDSLDGNLDSLIEMMEEDQETGNGGEGGGGGRPPTEQLAIGI